MVGSIAAMVEEVAGHVEVFLLARSLIELQQACLDDLVAGHLMELFRAVAKGAHHQIGIFDGDIEKIALSGGYIVLLSSLVEVSCVVQLVARLE